MCTEAHVVEYDNVCECGVYVVFVDIFRIAISRPDLPQAQYPKKDFYN